MRTGPLLPYVWPAGEDRRLGVREPRFSGADRMFQAKDILTREGALFPRADGIA